MTKKQWLRIHARLARIHEAVDDGEVRFYIGLAMREVDERVAEIEKER